MRLNDNPTAFHQVQVAKKTLRYSDAAAAVLGPPSKVEAREILRTIAGWDTTRIDRFENPKT